MRNNRYRRTINLIYVCGHVEHNVAVDCMNQAELIRRAKGPCPACQAAGYTALQEHAKTRAALGTAIDETNTTQEGTHDEHEHPATE